MHIVLGSTSYVSSSLFSTTLQVRSLFGSKRRDQIDDATWTRQSWKVKINVVCFVYLSIVNTMESEYYSLSSILADNHVSLLFHLQADDRKYHARSRSMFPVWDI